MLQKIFRQPRLARALQNNDIKLLLKAIKAGDDLNQPIRLSSEPSHSTKLTPVEQALRLQHPECLQKLLESGAELPQHDHTNRLLLSSAIGAPQHALTLTTVLLKAGANPNADNGEPLFNCLSLSDDNQLLLLINRLEQYGGDLNAFDRDGDTLLTRLLISQRTMLVGALISAGALLPDDIDQLDCSDEIKQFAKRKAQDLAVQRQLLGQ